MVAEKNLIINLKDNQLIQIIGDLYRRFLPPFSIALMELKQICAVLLISFSL